jgi:hypothetical protein
MAKFSLPRTKQCAKCPWKVKTNPFDIPNGYDLEKHKALKKTIAEPGRVNPNLNAMACHHSNGEDRMFCVGWLVNQLGDGNNIGLRMTMMNCENSRDLKVYGEQHETFEDTLPICAN